MKRLCRRTSSSSPGSWARAIVASPDETDIELFDGKVRDSRDSRRLKRGNYDIRQPSADAADDVLVKIDVRVEPCGGFGRADPPDEVFSLEEFERAIDRGLRHPGHVSAQLPENRLGGGVAQVLGDGSIDGQPLRGDPDAPSPTELLQIGAPAVYFVLGPVDRSIAIYFHMRIIIIWDPGWQAEVERGVTGVDRQGRKIDVSQHPLSNLPCLESEKHFSEKPFISGNAFNEVKK